MARPTLEPGKTRNKTIALRVTEDAHKKIEGMAKAKGMGVSAYLRMVLKRLFDGTILIR